MDYTAARLADEMVAALDRMPDTPAQAIARFRRARALVRRTEAALDKNEKRCAHIDAVRWIYEVPPRRSSSDPRHRATPTAAIEELSEKSQAIFMLTSAAQAAANQANAQHSTGPRSASGKAQSARNALRHGFRSQTVLLPGDDPADFQELLDTLTTHFAPVDLTDQRCVREMADAEWRLRRCGNTSK